MKRRLKKSIVLLLMLCLALMGVCTYSAKDSKEFKYKECFEAVYESLSPDSGNEFWQYYDEVYEYRSQGKQESDTPDLVLVFCADGYEFSTYWFVLGDYKLECGEYYPYTPGLYVVTPRDGKVYTLSDAYLQEVDGIMEMLESWSVNPETAYLRTEKLHDLDGDRRITVKEATAIQKHVADIAPIRNNVLDVDLNVSCPKASFPGFYYPVVYGGDFNYDGEINIKDATAIQKHIAGLPY